MKKNVIVLTIGLKYSGSATLNGPINDSILIEKLFDCAGNTVMSLRSVPNRKITKQDIIDKLNAWMDYEPESPHIFHFAGHGGQSCIKNRELFKYEQSLLEEDGKDEGIYDENLKLLKDFEFANLFKRMKGKLKEVIFIHDNCHSDDFIELDNEFSVISVAACADFDTTPEYHVTNIFGQRLCHGRLTHHLTSILKESYKNDFVSLLRENHQRIGFVRISDSFESLDFEMSTNNKRELHLETTDLYEYDDDSSVFDTSRAEKKVTTGCFC